MRKSLKILIAKAEVVIKIWKETTLVMDQKLEIAIPEMEVAIKKVKGES